MYGITCRGDLLPKVHLAATAEFPACGRSMNLPPLLKKIWTSPVNQDDQPRLVLCSGRHIPNELIPIENIGRAGNQVKIETVPKLCIAEHVRRGSTREITLSKFRLEQSTTQPHIDFSCVNPAVLKRQARVIAELWP